MPVVPKSLSPYPFACAMILLLAAAGCRDEPPAPAPTEPDEAPTASLPSEEEVHRERGPVEDGAPSAEALLVRYAKAVMGGDRREVVACFDSTHVTSARAATYEGLKSRTLRLRELVRETSQKRFGEEVAADTDARLDTLFRTEARQRPYEQLLETGSSLTENQEGVLLVALPDLPTLQLRRGQNDRWIIDASNWFGGPAEGLAAIANLEREVRILSACRAAARTVPDVDALLAEIEHALATGGADDDAAETSE